MKTNRLILFALLIIIFFHTNTYAVPIYYIDNAEVIGYNIIEELEKEKSISIKESEESLYTQEEIDLLIKVVHAEAGSSWLEDEHQQLVAAVVLNRVASKNYPNSIKEVVYQKGQYSCIDGPQWNVKPEKRTVENVYKVLNKEVEFPQNIIYQAEFKQGNKVYKSFLNTWSKTKTYFCYE